LHWMLRPGVIRVIEIFEEDKDTDASIGNILKIKVSSFNIIRLHHFLVCFLSYQPWQFEG